MTSRPLGKVHVPTCISIYMYESVKGNFNRVHVFNTLHTRLSGNASMEDLDVLMTMLNLRLVHLELFATRIKDALQLEEIQTACA